MPTPEIEGQDMKPIEKFGRFLVENLRDKSLDNLQLVFDGMWKAPELQPLQGKVSRLSPDLKAIVRALVEDLLTNAMHDMLFALQEAHDAETGIEVIVDGKPIAELSDGLHGELFGERGWIVRYSRFPSEAEINRSRRAEEEIKRMFADDHEGREEQ